MDVFRNDLKAADVPFIDDQVQRVDFHALRKTYCTNLARAGVNPWIAMKLMRHSDIHLTTKVYTDAGKLPLRESLGRLPDFFPALGKSCDVSHQRSQESGFAGQAVSLTGKKTTCGEPLPALMKVTIWHLLAQRVKKMKKWRRGDSNPRPSKRHSCIYARVRSLSSRYGCGRSADLRPQPASC